MCQGCCRNSDGDFVNSSPTELQLDALQELANVGCGQAADALSRLIGGRTIDMDVPRALNVQPDEIPTLGRDDKTPVVAARLKVEGELRGELALVFSEANAQRWCAHLIKAPAKSSLREEGRSALEEAANIAASAYLNAVGALTRLRLVPSVPQLSENAMKTFLQQTLAVPASESPRMVLVTRFWTREQPPVEGHILFVPDQASVRRLFRCLGV
jgi:chemotaxis protein CheC